MRNRTAIRLLYVLAVLAGIVPPILFLAYAFRQSAAQVEREMDFVGAGTVVRSESVVDTVASTLRKVATITQGNIDESTITTLRQAVFLDRYVQAIGIRNGDKLVCTSEHSLITDVVDSTAGQLPPKGSFKIAGPVDRDFPGRSMVLLYAFDEDRAIEGLVNPQIFTEFFDHYALESNCRVFVYFAGNAIASFGAEGLTVPNGVNLDSDESLQWIGNRLVHIARSDKYPIYTITVANSSLVMSRWTRSATEFAIAGILVSALLAWLVIRVAQRTQSLEADLREAVRYHELEVHYQPIVDLETGRCKGAEALMRWRHPRRGMIPAAEFIDVAERTGLIVPMTEVLLHRIAREFAPLLEDNPDMTIGINLAPQHFVTTTIIDSVKRTLGRCIPPEQIVFEITERGLVAEEDSIAHTVMTGLSASGAKLAVDDFGTGYSSLSYLQRFPLDFLKIDKAFVDGIESETTSSGLVDQIIRIADSLNMAVVAEGVEHACQAVYLKNHGVRLAQGWHFGKPMPIDEFRKFVLTRNSPTTRVPQKTDPAVATPRT